jgi:AcrR family transcriptional regulator
MKKSEVTRLRILESAEELFLEKPVDKVSVSLIAQKAKVAKGTFYLYFEAKEDIVWALMDKYLNNFATIFEHLNFNSYDFESVDKLIDTLFDFLISHKKEMFMFHQTTFHGFIGRERLEERYISLWREPIKNWLEMGGKLGYFRLSSTEFYVTFIMSSFHGIIDEFILGTTEFDDQIIRKEFKSIIRKLLG